MNPYDKQEFPKQPKHANCGYIIKPVYTETKEILVRDYIRMATRVYQKEHLN